MIPQNGTTQKLESKLKTVVRFKTVTQEEPELHSFHRQPRSQSHTEQFLCKEIQELAD